VLGISRRCLYNKLASYGISTSANHDEEATHEPNDEGSQENSSAKVQ
jgi:hypothetical protein